jgi:hypothetical protein
MAYLHYTRNQITTFIENVTQYQYSMKPCGLWLSQGLDWKEWCEDEHFSTCNLDTCYIYSTNLKKDTLCIIDSFESLNAFQVKYQKEDSHIDWQAVARDYDGICFENYHDVKRDYLYTSRSIKGIWILAIDVNSACIWNPSNVLQDWACERKGYDHMPKMPNKYNSDIHFQVHGTVQ